GPELGEHLVQPAEMLVPGAGHMSISTNLVNRLDQLLNDRHGSVISDVLRHKRERWRESVGHHAEDVGPVMARPEVFLKRQSEALVWKVLRNRTRPNRI